MEHGVRNVTVYVNGPGSGRESALRALQRRRLQDQPHPRRHARCRTTVAGRASAAASDHLKELEAWLVTLVQFVGSAGAKT